MRNKITTLLNDIQEISDEAEKAEEEKVEEVTSSKAFDLNGNSSI